MKKEYIDIMYDALDEKAFSDLCLNEEEIDQYYDGDFDYFSIFDGDPDYMVTENWDRIYFIIIWNRVYYITYWDWEGIYQLEEFCDGQDPKVSIWWNNTRSETKSRKYFEDENHNRDWFNNYKWLKIAYRWWCGYYYTLFKYE